MLMPSKLWRKRARLEHYPLAATSLAMFDVGASSLHKNSRPAAVVQQVEERRGS